MNRDLLSITLGELLALAGEQLAPRSAESDPWVNPSKCEISERQVRKAIRSGELRAYRVGRRLLVRRSELDAWIARPEHRVQPAVEEKDDAEDHADRILAAHGWNR